VKRLKHDFTAGNLIRDILQIFDEAEPSLNAFMASYSKVLKNRKVLYCSFVIKLSGHD